MPTELAPLTDAGGEPIGEWASEPLPGALGGWVRLIVVRTDEWSPAVRAGREDEAARAVAALDLERALSRGRPLRSRGLAALRAQDALQELVDEGALLRPDPLTAEMLEAFGWKPLAG